MAGVAWDKQLAGMAVTARVARTAGVANVANATCVVGVADVKPATAAAAVAAVAAAGIAGIAGKPAGNAFRLVGLGVKPPLGVHCGGGGLRPRLQLCSTFGRHRSAAASCLPAC